MKAYLWLFKPYSKKVPFPLFWSDEMPPNKINNCTFVFKEEVKYWVEDYYNKENDTFNGEIIFYKRLDLLDEL